MKDDGHKIGNINRKILGAWRDGHPGKPKIRELAQALSNIGKYQQQTIISYLN
jgi:hypothetical protein